MRFKRIELSPANKKQYLLALSKRDLELLHGEALNAYAHMPRTPDAKVDRQRLHGIVKGLEEALEAVKNDSDEGEKVHRFERSKYLSYKDSLDANPMAEITRLEIIDHRACTSCEGTGWKTPTDYGQRPTECKSCSGLGGRGRSVVFNSPDVEVTSSVQDQGKTLKLFVEERLNAT